MLWRVVKTRQVAGTIASMVPAYVDCWTHLHEYICIVNVIYCDRARSVQASIFSFAADALCQ